MPAWNGVPGWWPLGGPLWRGLVRSCAVWVAMGSLGGVLVVAVLVGGWRDPTVTLSSTEMALLTVTSVVILGFLGLMASVTFFNVPRSVVPPHLRAAPGAVSEWRSATERWSGRVRGRPAVLKPFLFIVFVLTGETIGAGSRESGDAPKTR